MISGGLSECAGCARDWEPHFQSTRFEGAPIFSLRAFKNLCDFLHDSIFIIMITQ